MNNTTAAGETHCPNCNSTRSHRVEGHSDDWLTLCSDCYTRLGRESKGTIAKLKAAAGETLTEHGLTHLQDLELADRRIEWEENDDPMMIEIVDAMQARITELQHALATVERSNAAYVEHNRTNDNRIAQLHQQLRDVYARDIGEVWYWQGDGTDDPESLVCPVQMPADTLRAMLRDLAASREQLATVEEENKRAYDMAIAAGWKMDGAETLEECIERGIARIDALQIGIETANKQGMRWFDRANEAECNLEASRAECGRYAAAIQSAEEQEFGRGVIEETYAEGWHAAVASIRAALTTPPEVGE